jgi:hypothetical protein
MWRKFGIGNKPKEDGVYVQWKRFNIASGSHDRRIDIKESGQFQISGYNGQ